MPGVACRSAWTVVLRTRRVQLPSAENPVDDVTIDQPG